jgi:hypothetical protein
MNKSNVTKIRASDRGALPSASGQVPLELRKYDLIGYVIFRHDTEEFFHSHREAPGYSTNAWCLEPSFAYVFDSEKAAFRYSIYFDKPAEIVPIYDLGDKFGVGFSGDVRI